MFLASFGHSINHELGCRDSDGQPQFGIITLCFQLGEAEAGQQDMKEGLDNFFSRTASSPGSSSIPIGSPLVEDVRSVSATSTPSPSLVSRSREDLRMKVRNVCVSVYTLFQFFL